MSTSYSLKEKVIKGSIIALGLSFLGSVFAYFIRILYSRTLSIEDYGLFYAILSLPLMFTIYLDLGFGYSSVYLLPKYLKLKKFAKAWNIFIYGQTVSLVMSILISLILIITAPLLTKYYFKVAGSEILIYIFCIFLIASGLINGMIQVYSGMQKEKYYSSITLLRWFLTFTLSIFFIFLGFSNILFFAIAWSAGHLITAIIYLALLYYKHSFLTVNKIFWERSTFRQMFSLAVPSILETFISSIFLMTVNFFLTFFRGVTEVGIYNVILPLASIPLVLLIPLNTFLLPLVSHLCEGEKDKLEFLTEQILKIIPLVGAYFSLFIILFPSTSISLIFGEKWLGKIESSLSILCLGMIFLLLNGILGVIALGLGKVRERLKIAIIIAILSVPANALLIWYWGVMGAVITIGLIALILNLLFINLIQKDLRIKIPYSFYITLAIFSSVVFILIRAIRISPQNWGEFIGFGLVYTFIYTVFGYLLKVFDKNLILMLLPQEISKTFLPLSK